MPLGTALALVGGPPVMAAVGWRGWWWGLGLLSVVVAAALGALLPADVRAVAAADRAASGWRGRLATTLRAPGPWLIALAFAAYSAQWLSLIGFLPTMYAQAGLSAGVAGAATALVAMVNMVGNIVAGRLLQRAVPAHRLLYAGFVAMAVGAALAFAPTDMPPSLRFAGALAFSMLGGLVPGTLFSLAVRVAPDEGSVSTTVGWMQQWSSFGQFAGPPRVAWVASRVGGWQWSGAVTGACALAGLWLAVRIGRQRSAAPLVKS
jgi:predicted MFS family arabinose efflux permease